MPELPDKLYFRIGEVAELVGVDAHVLRYWETEFKFRPHRSASGQRLYRKQDVTRFLRVRQLLHEEGFTIAGARRLLREGSEPARPGLGVEREKLKEALVRVRSARSNLRRLLADLAD
jgi:DNA-binding transcriptional MerR regulator